MISNFRTTAARARRGNDRTCRTGTRQLLALKGRIEDLGSIDIETLSALGRKES